MTKPVAEIVVDHQHGPIVRVSMGGQSVAIYLMAETAVVTNNDGQYGLEVSGLWPAFKSALAALVENANQLRAIAYWMERK